MELNEFIRKTLVDIKRGIHEANLELAKEEGKTLGEGVSVQYVMESLERERKEGYIAFDVAVTVSEENSKIGGGGIKVAVASLGAEIESSAAQEKVSRIKFHILPWRQVT